MIPPGFSICMKFHSTFVNIGFLGIKDTFWTLFTAIPHSSGWRALITNTKITISTVHGTMSDGRLSWDVTSHVDAWMVPNGGDKYKGSRYVDIMKPDRGLENSSNYLHQLHGVV